MHPMGGEQVGWEAVRASFEQAAGPMTDSHVELVDQRTYAGTDLAVTGIERGSAKLAGEPVEFEHRVTNVYRLEDGRWKMVHHHTDTSPDLVEILQRRQAAWKRARETRDRSGHQSDRRTEGETRQA